MKYHFCSLFNIILSFLIAASMSSAHQEWPNEKSLLIAKDTGMSAGLFPVCPGVTKNVSISRNMRKNFLMVLQRISPSGSVMRHSMPISKMPSAITDNRLDLKNKKTVVYAVGYLDSSVNMHNQAIANGYAKRGYNVFVSDTVTFLSYIYPKSVRMVFSLGKMIGDFLIKLHQQGLDPENLELVGTSLGAHVVSIAAKYFYSITGLKPSRLTGLDPAGPCFRSLGPEYRLDKSDAHFVDVIHTNIDGFGMADRLGHVDFYVNGGEYQPNDIVFLPCLVLCSHIRAFLYWWIALEHPKKFVAMQCDSIQDARFSNCYNSNVTNYMGLETDFSKPGIFYLPTDHKFPYYLGKAGLDIHNNVYKNILMGINEADNLVI